ncbi:MAG: hypothetical protein ACE37J_11920 [Pikeienuella sp.]|uniref:hypothetical protein n=1 Tax=Pikeienuella sp. TaxID=2831957 RepID=UPI003919E4A4
MMSIWTVSVGTVDFGDQPVARRHKIAHGRSRPTADLLTAPDLTALRTMLAECGLARIPRDPNDDPVIVESWL